MSELSFDDQVATVLRVAAELEGRWVVQKCRFGIWGGILINAIMPEAPVSQMWVPFSAQDTYETSGEAVAVGWSGAGRSRSGLHCEDRCGWPSCPCTAALRGRGLVGRWKIFGG